MRKDEKGAYFLNKNHEYYCQVQGVMHLLGTTECDFVVWTKKETLVISVKKDEAFIKEMLVLLRKFYFRYFLPNVCRKVRFDSELPEYEELTQK